MNAAERQPVEADLLSRVRLFRCLAPNDLLELCASLRRRSYCKGEVVYHQDDPPGSLFIIERGLVKLQTSAPTGKQITIGWLRAGNFFGTISLFSEVVRPENAIALESCDLLVLPRDDYLSFLRRHPEAAETVFQVLANRWHFAIRRLCDMACLDVSERIAKVLVDLAPTFGERERDGSVTIHHLTQPELAALVGATRESVHNSLHAYARQGWLEVQRGSVRILQMERLRQRLGS